MHDSKSDFVDQSYSLKTKSWSRLVKVSRTWSQGKIGHKWSGDQLRIVPASSHLTSLLMVSVNLSRDSSQPIFLLLIVEQLRPISKIQW